MLKRIFWLSLAAAVGWALWYLWHQRQEDYGATTPLLAPLEPFGRHIPPPTASSDRPAAAPAARAPEDMPAPAGAPDPSPQHEADTGATIGAEAKQPADNVGEVMGYCPRCKAKRMISDAREEFTESGRRAARGICSVCGGRMFTFLPNKVNE
jgi:hypothetical protein